MIKVIGKKKLDRKDRGLVEMELLAEMKLKLLASIYYNNNTDNCAM